MSTIKVNTIETRTGSTLTLGKSGDTVSIASGASTSGMGRTGTVDWQTSSIKGESFTAVNGEGYFLDTTDGSPYKNYAVTVVSGTLYGGGSGNIFNLDGSTQQAITLMKNKTYRFTQSDSSNDGHPLIISTSNSGTTSTFIAGIVSSGVTYYLDGSSNQTNYTNTTTFNAATTRYIEFKPSTTGTFYFGCYVHGVGMGGAITSQELTVTLPSSPSAGNIVAVKDYALNFDTEGIRINRNGSPINGTTGVQNELINTKGASIVLVYVDSTKGWIPTQDDASSLISVSPSYITASGGNTVSTDGDYKVHTFTSPGTFTVCSVGNQYGSNEVSYMVVAGGGAGGTHTNPSGQGGSGGGGAGGFREGKTPQCTYTSSPLVCTSGSNNGLPVTATGYPITVGGGGSQRNYPAPANGGDGSNSSFSTITSNGGGGGGRGGQSATGNTGGSGGGGAGAPGLHAGGAGNTPPTTPAQGTNGGSGKCGAYGGGGGGGATVAGWDAIAGAGNPTTAPTSGTGATTSINGTPTAYAGGGGGGGWSGGSASTNAGGAGGGGYGAYGPYPGSTNAAAGTTNTGGGGGGSFGAPNSDGGAGGSGIVIIRYKYQ
jgi:hypothetical protein